MINNATPKKQPKQDSGYSSISGGNPVDSGSISSGSPVGSESIGPGEPVRNGIGPGNPERQDIGPGSPSTNNITGGNPVGAPSIGPGSPINGNQPSMEPDSAITPHHMVKHRRHGTFSKEKLNL